MIVGRSINPVAVRRLDDAGTLEVQSTSGFWVKWSLLGDSAKKVVLEATSYAREEHGGSFPYESFLWVLADLEDGEPMPPQDPQDGEPNGDSPDQGEGDQEGNDQSPDQGQGGGGQPTVEDIIRRIAGEMDVKVAGDLGQFMLTQLDDIKAGFDSKLADFVPKGNGEDGGLMPIITRIEIITPEINTPKDGIFHNQFGHLTKLVASGQHVYLPGPPGTGKSHSAEQVAGVLDWRFASISLGPTTPESRLWGGMDAHGKFFEPPFVTLARYAAETPDSGAVFCLDELDNGHPGIIATLNSAMANGWFTAPNGDVITVGRNFVLIGAANTFGTGPTAEFAGRNKLDAATLDRFAYLPWDTDLAVEKALVGQYLDAQSAKAWLDVWRTCRRNVKDNGLKVFVTMRGAVNGARLIAGGLPPTDVLDMVLLNKLPDEQRRKVQP